jgi:choice-of-anchor C domain-containing protein
MRTQLGILILALTSVVQAAPFTNGGFENSPINPGSFTTLGEISTALTGWSIVGQGIDYIGTYWVAAEGSRSVDLSSTGAGGIQQLFDTIPGVTYNVTFSLAGNPVGGPAIKSVGVEIGATVTNFTFDTTGRSLTDMGWETRSLQFTATGTSTVLGFVSNTLTAFGPAIDNVSVSAIPEPATWAMFGGGLLAVALSRRKTRPKKS